MYTKAVLLLFTAVLFCEAKRMAPVGRLLNDVCNGTADAQQCRDVAVKCFPRRNRNSSASEWHDKVCSVLNGCMDKINGTRIIYRTYVHVIHDDFDMCHQMNHTDDHNHDMIPHDHLHDHNHDHPLDHNHDHPLDHTHDHDHNHTHDHDHDHAHDHAHGHIQGECIIFPPPMRRRRRIGFEDYLAQVEGDVKANDFRCCESKGFGKFNNDGKANVTAWKEDATRVEDPTAREALVKSIDSCAASEHSCSTHKFQLCIVSKCYDQIKTPKV